MSRFRRALGLVPVLVAAILVYALVIGFGGSPPLQAQAPINLNNPSGQGNLNVPGVPQAQFGPGLAQPGTFRNLLIGGDFGTNPWQRGTSVASITTTATYSADRWFAYSATPGDVSVSRQTSGAPSTFAAVLQFGRSASTPSVGQVCLGQIISTERSTPAQGQPVTVSFYAKRGANFSASGNLLSVLLTTGTGSDESAASLIAGTWTGQTNALNATRAISTSWTRYTMPAVTLGSTASQIAVRFCYTAVGTAGAADNLQFTGVQAEIAPTASPFERRAAATERMLAQRFAYVINEPASGIVVGQGQVRTTTTCHLPIPVPTTMRVAPTVTVPSLGSWKTTMASGGADTLSTLAASTGHTVDMINLLATASVASLTAGQSCGLMGAGGAGSVLASSEY